MQKLVIINPVIVNVPSLQKLSFSVFFYDNLIFFYVDNLYRLMYFRVDPVLGENTGKPKPKCTGVNGSGLNASAVLIANLPTISFKYIIISS